eukprot:10412328-Alexandrium_andersonii.AAC.1
MGAPVGSRGKAHAFVLTLILRGPLGGWPPQAIATADIWMAFFESKCRPEASTIEGPPMTPSIKGGRGGRC